MLVSLLLLDKNKKRMKMRRSVFADDSQPTDMQRTVVQYSEIWCGVMLCEIIEGFGVPKLDIMSTAAISVLQRRLDGSRP